MELKIRISEKSKDNLISGLLNSLDEIIKQIKQGFTSGGDKSDTGDFWFDIKE